MATVGLNLRGGGVTIKAVEDIINLVDVPLKNEPLYTFDASILLAFPSSQRFVLLISISSILAK